MRFLAVLGLLAVAVAGCGADGEPERPAAKPGVSITGTAEVGISG